MIERRGSHRQEGGEGSTNLQAGQDIVIYSGMSFADVRDIAESVVARNLKELRSEALATSQQRVSRFGEIFISTVPPEAIPHLADPDVQYAIATAGVGFVRSGDEDLAKMLVDLLTARCLTETRSLEAIVLNEAISVSPRLTDGQIAALATVWRLRWVVDTSRKSREQVYSDIKEVAERMVPRLPKGSGSYRHLESTGACSLALTGPSLKLADLVRGTYPGLFSAGFTREQLVPELQPLVDTRAHLFAQFQDDPSKLKLTATTANELEEQTADLDESAIASLKYLQTSFLVDLDVIRDELNDQGEAVMELQRLMSETGLGDVLLTSTGITIGHAEMRRVLGLKPPLKIWVSDDPE